MADLFFFHKEAYSDKMLFTSVSSHMMLISFKSLGNKLDIPKYFYPFKHLPCVGVGGNGRVVTIST